MGRKRKRRQSDNTDRLAAIIIGVVLISVVGVSGLMWYFIKKNRKDDMNTVQSGSGSIFTSNSELSKAIAETEKTDRQWRLADIAAARGKLDPARNGGPYALSAARQIPQNAINSLDGFEVRRSPSSPIPDFEVQRLRNTLQGCGPALTEAHKIALTPQGRFDINFNFQKPIDTMLEDEQNSRKTAWLLVHDAELRAADRDAAGAIQDVAGLLILGRYLEDEPVLISQLVRIAIHMLAIGALERAMTCSAVSDDSLKSIQALLESEASVKPLVISLRGERAMYHAMIESKNYQNTNLSDADHAWAIRMFKRAIDIAQKGPPYYSDEWTTLVNDLQNGPLAATRIMPHFGKVRDALVRQVASLRAAAIGIAAERYRRDKGEWPRDLKLLAPDYIKSIPTDPYFGGQFSYSRSIGGFSIFVKGNAPFVNGEFNTIGNTPDLCQGFRLINPELRR
jgi:hypothetical protein